MINGIFKNGELSEEDAKDLERQVSKISDYIKREDALDACYEETSSKWSTKEETEEGKIIAGVIRSIPSADVVEVVRCKDCKHWREYMAGLGACDKLKTDMDGSSYCNHGEHSEEVKDNELDFLDEESEHEIERQIKALRRGEE